MLFNSALFAIFLIAFFVTFKFVARSRVQKLWVITAGSLLFYAAWDYRFAPLLLGTALLDFYVARAIQHTSETRSRGRLLAFSVAANVGVLAFFKYANFAVGSAWGLGNALGLSMGATPVLDIVLPAGISFYTFQSMSYTIDVYRGELQARERPVEFLAAVSFFPHLVAGPIVRASTLLPQFEKFRALPWEAIRRGFVLIGTGLALKTMADHLAGPANALFDAAAAPSALVAWTGVIAFAGQIFGDFAGYTDIAIGVSLLLGFKIPPNFDLPFLATSPVDYWRRWHISLSTWLRDYLFMSLGGFRRGGYRNLLATMLLGGLWHGANWTFVAWGLYHGALLVATHLLIGVFRPTKMSWPARVGAIAFTFYLNLIGFVLFRAESFADAGSILRAMHAPLTPSRWDYAGIVTLALVVAAVPLTHAISAIGKVAERPTRTWLLWSFVVVAVAAAMAFSGRSNTFIYFQF